jgi:glycosyl-4,4'-diaponeurosporenoate acyltransferase
MIFHLPVLVTVLIDIAAWFAIHMGVSYFMTLIPRSNFNTSFWLYKTGKWESNSKVYETLFSVKNWKKRLPDGAALFKGGFKKKHLNGTDLAYLDDFIRETCRAELTHWIVFLFGFVFLIWNLWWVGIIMLVYAFSVNMPCIITQRYNRVRLRKLCCKLMQVSWDTYH